MSGLRAAGYDYFAIASKLNTLDFPRPEGRWTAANARAVWLGQYDWVRNVPVLQRYL